MHEASLAQKLIDQVTQLAEQHAAQHVRMVRVQFGPLSGIEPDLFTLAFERLKLGTPLECCHLQWSFVGLSARCEDCRQEFMSTELCFACPACGSRRVTLLGGDAIMLESVTLDVDTPVAETT